LVAELGLEAAGFDEEVIAAVDGFDTQLERLVFPEIHQGVARPDSERVAGGSAGLEGECLDRRATGVLGLGWIEVGRGWDGSDGFPCACQGGVGGERDRRMAGTNSPRLLAGRFRGSGIFRSPMQGFAADEELFFGAGFESDRKAGMEFGSLKSDGFATC
jgi:hypothetical protein